MNQIWLQSDFRRGKESGTHRQTPLKYILGTDDGKIIREQILAILSSQKFSSLNPGILKIFFLVETLSRVFPRFVKNNCLKHFNH